MPPPYGMTGSQVAVEWSDWLKVYAAWPLGIQLAATVLFRLALAPLFRKAAKGRVFRKFVRDYIGTYDSQELLYPIPLVTLCSVQAVSSSMTVGIWIACTYFKDTTEATKRMISVTVFIDLLNWMTNRLRAGCKASSLWDTNALVDTFTIVPRVYMQLKATEDQTINLDWLSLQFLRSYSILFNFQKIQSTGFVKHTRVKTQIIILTMLRVYCLLIPMTGMVFTLEVLGEPDLIQDRFVQTVAGDMVSFDQMLNWVIVSICTLGDGVFYPRTVFSRWVWSVGLVFAVGYIFWLQFSFGQSWSKSKEGNGLYSPRGRPYVVVVLRVNQSAKKLQSIVQGLINEVLHTTIPNSQLPDVVILSPVPWDPSMEGSFRGSTFKDFLNEISLRASAQQHVFFIVGDMNRKQDLNRVKVGSAQLTLLVPDVNSSEPDKDDELNISTALSLKKLFPEVRLRLMLLRPQSKELAVQAGILVTRCFSVRELKAHMFAQNVRCHGMIPILVGILKSVDLDEELPDLDPGDPDDSWTQEYMEGLQRCMYGFEVSPKFDGSTFGELASSAFEASGAVVFAMLDEGKIQIVPQGTHGKRLCSRQICFAIAKDMECLDCVRDTDEDPYHWRSRTLQIRDALALRTKEEGPHLTAAQLLGSQINDSLLKDDAADIEDVRNPFSRGTSPEEMVPELERKSDRRETNGSFGGGSCAGSVAGSFAGSFAGSAYGSAYGGISHGSAIDPNEVAEMAEVNKLQQVKELRAGVLRGEELVLVVVCNGEVWQQVRSFVGALRSRYLPVFRPIVILAPTAPPPRLLAKINDRVVTMVGSCTKVQQLIDAGAVDAGSIVVMTGEAFANGAFQAGSVQDCQTVLCAAVLECWCSILPREVFITYELQESRSVNDLPPLVTRPAVDLHKFLDQQAFMDDAEEEDEEEEEEVPKKQSNTSSLPVFSSSRERSITFNTRFAAGQVFTPEIWGCMLGRMFHNPATIELLEALIMPQRRGQKSFPWQVKVLPAYVDRPFSDLLHALTLVSWVEGAREKIRIGPAVPLGVYRRHAALTCDDGRPAALGTGGGNHCILAPSGSLLLGENDWVVVVGSRLFGRRMQQLGLLRGGKGVSEEAKTSPADGGGSARVNGHLQPVQEETPAQEKETDEQTQENNTNDENTKLALAAGREKHLNLNGSPSTEGTSTGLPDDERADSWIEQLLPAYDKVTNFDSEPPGGLPSKKSGSERRINFSSPIIEVDSEKSASSSDKNKQHLPSGNPCHDPSSMQKIKIGQKLITMSGAEGRVLKNMGSEVLLLMAGNSKEVVGMDELARINITILGARGMRNADWRGKDELRPFCSCMLAGKPSSEVRTPCVAPASRVSWKHEAEVLCAKSGNNLNFCIWGFEPATGDEFLLGEVILKTDMFIDDCFDGELQLFQNNRPIQCYLKVFVAGTGLPEGNMFPTSNSVTKLVKPIVVKNSGRKGEWCCGSGDVMRV